MKLCQVKDCGRKAVARDYCITHYQRWSGRINLPLRAPIGPTSNGTPDILRETGASYRQLDYWVRVGWLNPGKPFAGSGSRREWTPEEVEKARWLVKASLLTLPEIAEFLKERELEDALNERKSA